MGEWQPIETAPEGREVLTRIDDEQGERNVQVLTRQGHLWWADSMYVYYTPTHWKPALQAQGGEDPVSASKLIPQLPIQIGPFALQRLDEKWKLVGPHGYFEWLPPGDLFSYYRAMLDAYEQWWRDVRSARVYFIGETLKVGLPIKIGMSENPRARLRTLQTSHHAPLQILAIDYGGKRQESALHARYAKARLNGEWFTVTDAMRSFIRGLQSTLEAKMAELDEHPITRANAYDDHFARQDELSALFGEPPRGWSL